MFEGCKLHAKLLLFFEICKHIIKKQKILRILSGDGRLVIGDWLLVIWGRVDTKKDTHRVSFCVLPGTRRSEMSGSNYFAMQNGEPSLPHSPHHNKVVAGTPLGGFESA